MINWKSEGGHASKYKIKNGFMIERVDIFNGVLILRCDYKYGVINGECELYCQDGSTNMKLSFDMPTNPSLPKVRVQGLVRPFAQFAVWLPTPF